MILCALIGYGVARFAGVSSGVVIGLFAGLLIAPLVPKPAPDA